MAAPTTAPSSQMYCINCGDQIAIGTSFCRRCGSPTSPDGHAHSIAGEAAGSARSAGATGSAVSVPWATANGVGYAPPLVAFPPAHPVPDHLNDTFVAAGKTITLALLHGVALAVVFRFIISGLVQAAIGLFVQGLGDRLLSSSTLSQLGLGGLNLGALVGPLHGAIGQIGTAIGRSVGAPPLPSLILSTMLGLLVLAVVPILIVLTDEPLRRWRILGAAPEAGDAATSGRSGGELALASADASVTWLVKWLPYAGVALLLSFIGLAPAVIGFLLWLLAGAMLLDDQLAPKAAILRLALPAVYSVAVLLMIWIAAQGVQILGI